jgi:hypothetical protein
MRRSKKEGIATVIYDHGIDARIVVQYTAIHTYMRKGCSGITILIFATFSFLRLLYPSDFWVDSDLFHYINRSFMFWGFVTISLLDLRIARCLGLWLFFDSSIYFEYFLFPLDISE